MNNRGKNLECVAKVIEVDCIKFLAQIEENTIFLNGKIVL